MGSEKMKSKTDLFFEMLEGQYGKGKMNAAWGDDLSLQLAKELWRDQIEQHTEQQLAAALATVRKMMISNQRAGDNDSDWVNVGLILSCVVKRTDNTLPRYRNETPEEREKNRLYRIGKMAQLRKDVGL
jgi:hypothetical protein